MIIDKTEIFMQLRQSTVQSPFEPISVDEIKNILKDLSTEIQLFKNKIEKNKLPSFQNKVKKITELKLIKDKIDLKIKEITIKIKEIKLTNKQLSNSIQEYFFNILKKKIIIYKEYEAVEVLESSNSESQDLFYNESSQELMEKENIYKNNQIRASLLNLSNSINQLKVVLKNQTSLIDTIDYYFDKSNIHLEEANKEIAKIPKNYTVYKDKIIWILLYLICILMGMIVFKSLRIRIKNINDLKAFKNTLKNKV